jgi:hypothetical protein
MMDKTSSSLIIPGMSLVQVRLGISILLFTRKDFNFKGNPFGIDQNLAQT